MDNKVQQYMKARTNEDKVKILQSIDDNEKPKFFELLNKKTIEVSNNEESEFINTEMKKVIDMASKEVSSYLGPVFKVIDILSKLLRAQLNEYLSDLLKTVGAEKIVDLTIDSLAKVLKTVLRTFFVAICNKNFWITIREICEKTWKEREGEGLLTQTFACSKKIVGSFVYALILCTEKALSDNNITLTEEEQNNFRRVIIGHIEGNIVQEDSTRPAILGASSANQ